MASVGTTKTYGLVNLDNDLVDLVLELSKEYDKEDRQERDNNRPLWMKLESYFEGVQRIYWDQVARDYRSLDATPGNQTMRHYDKIINIYRAHGESIIAALSVKTPSAIFYPNDADVEADITTAKVCIKIKQEIERHNEAIMLLIRILVILWNQGTVAAYIYNRRNSKFGTYTTPVHGDKAVINTVLLNCPECGNNIDEIVSKNEKAKIPEEAKTCPVCGYHGIPIQDEYNEEVADIIGAKLQPKSRTQIEVYSPLFVYLPFYARKQEHIPYLRLKFEQHYSALKNLYPKLKKKGFTSKIDAQNAEERGINIGVNHSNLSTVECLWIRPWGYDLLDGKDDEIKRLRKKYPDGVYAIIIDDQLVEINNEALDDHWAISANPLSTYIHGQPLGKPLAPIQDLENEIVDLQIETFEHSIPETFARGDVLDFNKYSQSKAAPGMIYPAMTPADGASIGDSFHTLKTATLSEEADLFHRKLDDKGQFVSGSFPSIYGGPATSGSKTAREYTESRAMALQRLSIPWNTLKNLWADIMSKAVPLAIHAMRETGENEKIVEKGKTGFINTWIRQEDLDGKIGRVEADVEEDLPQSAGQLKDLIIQLLGLKDDYISEAMYHPQNLPLITKALGAPDFYIPNADDRDKQYQEFVDLLNGIPVEVDPEIDDNEVEAEVCRTFLVSATGLMLKKSNPEGRKMIEEHYKAHIEAAKMKSMEQQPVDPNAPSPGPVNPEGEQNVPQ